LFVGSEAAVLVAERDTGRPVPGAAVRPYYDNCYYGGAPTGEPGRPVYTDAEGRARIKVPGAIKFNGFAVEAEGYDQSFPLDMFGGARSYHIGESAADGTRVLHVRPVTQRGAGAK